MKFATINFEGAAEPIVALEEKEPRLLKDVCKKLNAPNFDCLENFISFLIISPSGERTDITAVFFPLIITPSIRA